MREANEQIIRPGPAMVDHRQCRRPARRGLAILLVLISLMMATILTTAYLASRDNSSAIGDNVASAAAARWAADSGLEFSVAILETETPWRTSHVNGRLLSNYPLAGGAVNVDLVDIETGLAPTSSSEYVRMTSTATVDGVSQSSIADCHVPLTTDPTADIDLSEFSMFAGTLLSMKGKATLARWPTAPLSRIGERVLVGTRATSASSITLEADSSAIDTTVFHGPGASATLVSVSNSQPPEQVKLLDAIPLPMAPSSGVSAPSGASTDLTVSGGSTITNTNTRWKNVDIKSAAVRTLRGNITVIADGKFEIHENSKVVVDGQVKLVVFGDLKMDNGAIELKPGASLVAYVYGSSGTALDIKDSYIGEIRAASIIDTTGNAPYMDAERVVIFSNPTGSNTTWDIHGVSAVKGSLYAPNPQQVRIRDQSALYGRVAASAIKVENEATVFYDPALNNHAGFSTATSAVFDSTGHIKAAIQSLSSLDTSALQMVADTSGVLVTGVAKQFSLIKPTGYSSSGGSPIVGPTDPTPRPIEVTATVVTFGNALDSWE